MSKHILDSTRVRSGSTKFLQYARIDLSERPHPQSKVLQKQSRRADPHARMRRFLEISRRKD
jgi:hypothetical protein